MGMLEIDLTGWQQQNSGRELYELIREGVQNALDTGEDIEVTINTRNREIVIEDDGEGFSDLSEAWTVFAGSKGDDVTKRGRYGRGIKELIAGCEILTVETVGGIVKFDVFNERRWVDEEHGRDSGTVIRARNSQWTADDIRGVREWVENLWVPEGQTVTVNVKGGSDIEKNRSDWEPDSVMRCYLRTVVVEDGMMKKDRRMTEVEVKEAKPGDGRVYEMEIPVNFDEDFPLWFNVQQKIPLAEQRNAADSKFVDRLVCYYINQHIDRISEEQLQKEWVTSRLDRIHVDSDAMKTWARRVYGEDTLVSSTDYADDKAEQYGKKVVDADNLSFGQSKAVTKAFPGTNSWATEFDAETTGQRVEPTEEQQEFIDTMYEKVLEPLNKEYIEVELWELPSNEDGKVVARFCDGTVSLNVLEREWDEVNTRNVGTFVHEIAHDETDEHDMEFISELECLFGALLVDEWGV